MVPEDVYLGLEDIQKMPDEELPSHRTILELTDEDVLRILETLPNKTTSSRLLRGSGVLAAQTLRARGPNGVATMRRMVSGGSIPTDEEQMMGLESKVRMATRQGPDPCNMLVLMAAAGTKEDPNLVPSITNKRPVGCICEEDNSAIIWFGLHKGDAQRCPNCGTHYKLVPHQLAH
ncbi:cytochrome c oxidase subunit 5B, mitochondrial-like [Echinops telfairi]|uniref:Cytochrome c oxidase subunit 5B, mitochondrial-like n=1 Tax=Echinops telfairi TaxID=9371 RepID=A0AC55D8X1_ECHTE|nr:cytochrome c oxidase subunit 5B, mitochondrial-like [Echinops telfairi]